MSVTTVMVERWLRELPNPDSELGQTARNELIEHGRRRMQAICGKMFYPSLRGTPVDQDDVYQESALRLWKALSEVQPTSVQEFFGLASTQIRRVLIDLCRKRIGKTPKSDQSDVAHDVDPSIIAKWTEFHEQVGKLDKPLKQVVELLWYHDLTQREAAEVMGVDESTVKRRWRKAREKLAEYVI